MEELRKAVSIVFVHGKDIFTVVRQNYLKAFPGYTAFPGGKVDKSDKGENLEMTLINALKREVREELGIDLSEFEKNGVVKEISKVAKATSPDFNPVRFEVYFYRVILSKKIEFNVDENEVFSSSWLDSSSLMQEYNFGKRLMILPIRKMIEALGQAPDFSDFINFDLMLRGDIPKVEPIKNLIQLMPKSNTILPATRTNAFVIGDQVKTLVDPSPKDMDEYRLLLEELKAFRFDKIFISHHHKDHHQYAPELASALGLPIYISQDSLTRCQKKYGEDYFGEGPITIVQDGDVICSWRSKDVIAISVPGHDEGQYALMPKTKEWCFVGDLFQGIGTVVVGGEEGNMSKYMDSLKRIISLAPNCVIPSHGIALGGTYILEKTLKHRQMREEQILDLYMKGKSTEEILKIVYFDISRKLHPYAKANIESHLDKLKEEGKI